MTYNPTEYWQAAGTDTAHREHESRFVRADVFAEQERALLATLDGLEFKSVLEVGCGFGRITRLVSERWPEASYTAIDLSAERLASAQRKAPNVEFIQTTIQGYKTRRKWDLVLAVETLMHVPGGEVEQVIERLLAMTRKHLVTLDWAVPLPAGTAIAPWNECHDYAGLYGERLRSVEQVGPLQAVYVVEP